MIKMMNQNDHDRVLYSIRKSSFQYFYRNTLATSNEPISTKYIQQLCASTYAVYIFKVSINTPCIPKYIWFQLQQTLTTPQTGKMIQAMVNNHRQINWNPWQINRNHGKIVEHHGKNNIAMNKNNLTPWQNQLKPWNNRVRHGRTWDVITG